jgi:hypothetical protein
VRAVNSIDLAGKGRVEGLKESERGRGSSKQRVGGGGGGGGVEMSEVERES